MNRQYTLEVERLAERIRALTAAELLALSDLLRGQRPDADPDSGVREPRRPVGPTLTGEADPPSSDKASG